jgi:hypothetical protein
MLKMLLALRSVQANAVTLRGAPNGHQLVGRLRHRLGVKTGVPHFQDVDAEGCHPKASLLTLCSQATWQQAPQFEASANSTIAAAVW